MDLLKSVQTFLLDTLFPINCLGCGRNDIWFCEGCLKKIELLSFQKCPVCETSITEDGRTCHKCKSSSSLDALLVATRYKENIISKLIHSYKYKFVEDLHAPLGNLMLKTIISSKLPLPDLIIPVPLHPRRLRWRGFNQSGLLARYLGKNITSGFEIPVLENLLARKRYTQSQMKIKKYSQRRENIKDAFGLKNFKNGHTQSYLKGKTVLLVDDIATTGATLFECAKILKASGAKKVFGSVISRQETDIA